MIGWTNNDICLLLGHPSGSKSFDVKSNQKLNTTPIPEDNENFSLSKEQERDVGIKETGFDRVHSKCINIPTDEEVSMDQNNESSLDRGSRYMLILCMSMFVCLLNDYLFLSQELLLFRTVSHWMMIVSLH